MVLGSPPSVGGLSWPQEENNEVRRERELLASINFGKYVELLEDQDLEKTN